MVFLYLLNLIFNIYVVLYSALFPFAKKKKNPMRELTQLSPIPDSGVFTRIEERKDEEWGGVLPFPCLDVLRERGFEGIS